MEGLKNGIWEGDIVTLGKVEQAVGKVAEGIDVYLILAVSKESQQQNSFRGRVVEG